MNVLFEKAFLFAAVLLIFASCQHHPYTSVTVELERGPLRECDPDTFYFEKDVQPLLTTYCVSGCHDEATASDGVVLTSYSRIMSTAEVRAGNPSNSELYEVITETDPDKRMPPPPAATLTAENIEIIRKWIIQGALNNTCNYDTLPTDTTDTNNAGCNPVNVSFANDVTPIFSSYGCIGCHTGGSVILSTYAGTKIVADNGKLVGAINHSAGFQAMPQGGAKMDSCDIKVIENWINEGTLDN